MLITADWAVPVSSAPIRDGAVVLRNGLIEAVGPADGLAKKYAGVPRHDHPGCIIMPGLVNAHTHLALTCLKGLLPPQPFAEWIRRVPQAMLALNRDDLASSTALGAANCIQAGVTVVGDIAHGPESAAIAADAGLGGQFYWEVLGIPAKQIDDYLDAIEFPAGRSGFTRRLNCGISPHAPYTSGPELIRAARALAAERRMGFAVHLAESVAETQLLHDGSGPLADLAKRLADGFEPPCKTPVAYMEMLGVLEGAVAVHCTQVLPVDIPVLARRVRGVVLCPRSNAHLNNGVAPAEKLGKGGVPLGLGTDSLASNETLDLFEEARALAEIAPGLGAERLVRMMTDEGAQILGLGDVFGSLARGLQADIAIFRIPHSKDPYEGLLQHAGRRSLEAVLSAGLWRILHGQPTFPVSFADRGSQLASMKAALALDDSHTV